jgi:hypothetical protein
MALCAGSGSAGLRIIRQGRKSKSESEAYGCYKKSLAHDWVSVNDAVTPCWSFVAALTSCSLHAMSQRPRDTLNKHYKSNRYNQFPYCNGNLFSRLDGQVIRVRYIATPIKFGLALAMRIA